VWGALHYAREHRLGEDDVMVVILPDTGSRYLSKVFNDDWMRENGFLERTWVDFQAADIQQAKGTDGLITASPQDRLTEVVSLLKENGISQVPVVDEDGGLVGLVREIDLLNHMLTAGHKHERDETIESMIDRNVAVIQATTPLETLMGIFSNRRAVVIVSGDKVQGILTQIDLLDFLSGQIGKPEVS
jgi:cystathionine beta-synthase